MCNGSRDEDARLAIGGEAHIRGPTYLLLIIISCMHIVRFISFVCHLGILTSYYLLPIRIDKHVCTSFRHVFHIFQINEHSLELVQLSKLEKKKDWIISK